MFGAGSIWGKLDGLKREKITPTDRSLNYEVQDFSKGWVGLSSDGLTLNAAPMIH